VDLELTGRRPRGLGEARGAWMCALRRANTGRPFRPAPAR